MTTNISFMPSSFYNFETSSSSSQISSSFTEHLWTATSTNLESQITADYPQLSWKFQRTHGIVGWMDGISEDANHWSSSFYDMVNGTQNMETKSKGCDAIQRCPNNEEVVMTTNAFPEESQWTSTTSFPWAIIHSSTISVPISTTTTNSHPRYSREPNWHWCRNQRISHWNQGRPQASHQMWGRQKWQRVPLLGASQPFGHQQLGGQSQLGCTIFINCIQLVGSMTALSQPHSVQPFLYFYYLNHKNSIVIP